MLDTTSHLLQLVGTALDEFETVPISASVRRAWRIARLCGDSVEAIRFALELGVPDDYERALQALEAAPFAQRAGEAYATGRTGSVEARLLGFEEGPVRFLEPLDELQRKPSAHEPDLSLKSRVERENRRVVVDAIVAVIRNVTYSYLMACETTLRLSVTGGAVFDRHRATVDGLLRSIAPEVLDKLSSAIRTAGTSEDTEARAHALLSCRRVLVAVADHVFPARHDPHVDAGGNSRVVGPSQYRNRILAAIELNSPNTLGAAVTAAIEDLAGRLDRLDELTQKGVHADVTAHEVDFAVIQTYLLAGEILALHREAEPNS